MPYSAHFSMPSFYLRLSHCRTCTVHLTLGLAKAWTRIIIQRMMTCFKTDALLSFNSQPVNMSNLNRRSSSLTMASVTSPWLMVPLTKCCDNNFLINMSTCRKNTKVKLLNSNTYLSPTDGSCPLLGIYRHRNRLQCQIVPLHSNSQLHQPLLRSLSLVNLKQLKRDVACHVTNYILFISFQFLIHCRCYWRSVFLRPISFHGSNQRLIEQ